MNNRQAEGVACESPNPVVNGTINGTATMATLVNGEGDVISSGDVAEELLPVVVGLTSQRKYVPHWYLYDTRGSELYEELVHKSPTYKLWEHEYSVLKTHGDEISSKVSSPAVLVELGSGASSKTRLIIEAMLKRHGNFTFVPVDIAEEFIEDCGRQLERDYPGLTVEPFGGLYMDGVRHVAARPEAKMLLFLGSSFSNIPITEQLKMMVDIRMRLSAQDRLVLGLDMNTDREALSKAYDAQWSPWLRDNFICRLNQDFGGDMKKEKFEYNFDFVENPADDDTPSYVQLSISSIGNQRVYFEKMSLDIDFQDGEKIYLAEGPNYSCKWNLKQLRHLAEKSGFTVDAHWANNENTYCIVSFAPADTVASSA
ncbi:histidine N-alpha-methyltransferase-like [Branchiostoma lanceolatum]|uniref:histidine N-alpha-methyltransferase-like n=1 Tax=Branchiostoma lanceolatum TaxID=7740 RepID=UPI003453F250